jgi:hypothetical protein
MEVFSLVSERTLFANETLADPICWAPFTYMNSHGICASGKSSLVVDGIVIIGSASLAACGLFLVLMTTKKYVSR